MPRYKPKTKYSRHAEKRYGQRYKGDSNMADLARRAFRFGLHFSQIPPGMALSGYVLSKKAKMNKKIRLLEGYLFVFSRNGRLMTMYPLPEEYMGEYSTLSHIERENREEYRKWRRGQ